MKTTTKLSGHTTRFSPTVILILRSFSERVAFQGVILGGLMHLYLYTENQTYLDVAVKLANASSTLLVYPNGLLKPYLLTSFTVSIWSGILKESCEPSNCDQDQQQFKV